MYPRLLLTSAPVLLCQPPPLRQGPRNCLGQHLALLEARVVLSLLVKRFRFRSAGTNMGERHPTVVPVGPKHSMMMMLD